MQLILRERVLTEAVPATACFFGPGRYEIDMDRPAPNGAGKKEAQWRDPTATCPPTCMSGRVPPHVHLDPSSYHCRMLVREARARNAACS